MADFTLDTSILGSGDIEVTDTLTPGRGTAVQLEYSQGGANRDLELSGYTIWVTPGGPSWDSTLGEATDDGLQDIEIRTTMTASRGRQVQLEYSQGGANRDLEIVGYAMWIHPQDPKYD